MEDDVLKFVLDTYGKKIWDYLKSKELTITFFSESEEYVDTIENEEYNLIMNGYFSIKVLQDYSVDTNKNMYITDLNYCTVEGYKFVKVVTPFTMTRSYDFIVAKSNEINAIIKILKDRELKRNFKYKEIPIIGFDFKEIEDSTIKFLMNDEFRNYCSEHHIRLKRGIILQGEPGTGKTLTLQWLRQQCELNGIKFEQFKNIDDFVKNSDEYYREGKKIFVFEDFDAALVERENTGMAPNQILGMVLNTLEGVEDINDVVSIFTTNHIDVFDKAFIRPGRIDKVITYSLPGEKEYREFFQAYIPEEERFFDDMIEHLKFSNFHTSYAILKGICDDINIFKFSGENLTKEKTIDIIREKLSSANKAKEEKKTSDYIL